MLIGLDADDLSLNPTGIPLIKTILRQIDTPEATALAEQALLATSATAVRKLAQEFMQKLDLPVLKNG